MKTKAVWHNPENAPAVKGWRFLTKEEACHLQSQRTLVDVQIYLAYCSGGMTAGNDRTRIVDHWTYYTDKPLGYFLPKKPKPKRKVEGPSKGYMDAYNKFMGTGYKDPQSCIAGTMMPFHFFNAGRRYERRRLKAKNEN